MAFFVPGVTLSTGMEAGRRDDIAAFGADVDAGLFAGGVAQSVMVGEEPMLAAATGHRYSRWRQGAIRLFQFVEAVLAAMAIVDVQGVKAGAMARRNADVGLRRLAPPVFDQLQVGRRVFESVGCQRLLALWLARKNGQLEPVGVGDSRLDLSVVVVTAGSSAHRMVPRG